MLAPWSEQVMLLKVQQIDTRIARTRFQLRKLPEREQLNKINEGLKVLQNKNLQVVTLVSDQEIKMRTLDKDLKQLLERNTIQQERLDTGQGSPKELMAIQNELAQISKRKADLETAQMEIMTELDRLEQIKEKIADKKQELSEQAEQINGSLDQQVKQMESEISELERKRADFTKGISEELMRVYQEVCERTGGVGAIKLVDLQAPGMDIEFSAAEAGKIRSASPDEVLCSEEYDYILVRFQE